MSVRDYGMEFNSLVMYALMIVDTMEARIHIYIGGLAPEYVKAYTIVELNNDIHFSHIQAVAQNLEESRHLQFGEKTD